MKIDNYLILTENRNAMDSLIQSLTFLSQVEQNLFYWKWFIIAFHSAVYSFMLLTIQSIDHDQIYQILPKHFRRKKDNSGKGEFSPFDGKLISFLSAYEKLKNPIFTKDKSLIGSNDLDECMKELNNKLRNQMLHFIPMTWGSEGWYPALVCNPILEVILFCVKSNNLRLSELENETVLSHTVAIKILLTKHTKSFESED